MTVLSIDIGSTNFGWSLWSQQRGFYDFGVINLNKVQGKDLPEKMHSLHKRGFFDSADVILVERQMRAKFKVCCTAIRCMGNNFSKTHIIAPQSVKRHFSTSKVNHRQNKKAHIELAKSFLNQEELSRLDKIKKKDDVCDTIVQTRYWESKEKFKL